MEEGAKWATVTGVEVFVFWSGLRTLLSRVCELCRSAVANCCIINTGIAVLEIQSLSSGSFGNKDTAQSPKGNKKAWCYLYTRLAEFEAPWAMVIILLFQPQDTIPGRPGTGAQGRAPDTGALDLTLNNKYLIFVDRHHFEGLYE